MVENKISVPLQKDKLLNKNDKNTDWHCVIVSFIFVFSAKRKNISAGSGSQRQGENHKRNNLQSNGNK